MTSSLEKPQNSRDKKSLIERSKKWLAPIATFTALALIPASEKQIIKTEAKTQPNTTEQAQKVEAPEADFEHNLAGENQEEALTKFRESFNEKKGELEIGDTVKVNLGKTKDGKQITRASKIVGEGLFKDQKTEQERVNNPNTELFVQNLSEQITEAGIIIPKSVEAQAQATNQKREKTQNKLIQEVGGKIWNSIKTPLQGLGIGLTAGLGLLGGVDMVNRKRKRLQESFKETSQELEAEEVKVVAPSEIEPVGIPPIQSVPVEKVGEALNNPNQTIEASAVEVTESPAQKLEGTTPANIPNNFGSLGVETENAVDIPVNGEEKTESIEVQETTGVHQVGEGDTEKNDNKVSFKYTAEEPKKIKIKSNLFSTVIPPDGNQSQSAESLINNLRGIPKRTEEEKNKEKLKPLPAPWNKNEDTKSLAKVFQQIATEITPEGENNTYTEKQVSTIWETFQSEKATGNMYKISRFFPEDKKITDISEYEEEMLKNIPILLNSQ